MPRKRTIAAYSCLSIALTTLMSGCGEPEVEPNDTALLAAENPEQPILDLGADHWAAWGVLSGPDDVDAWLVADRNDDMEGFAEQAPVLSKSPLIASTTPHPLHAFGVRWMAFDPLAYERLAVAADAGRGARIEGLQISDEIIVSLDLQPIEVFSDDVMIVAAEMTGTGVEDRAIDRPDFILLEGTVTGVEDSEVFLSISPTSSNGWIRIREQKHMIATELEDPKRRTVIYDLNALPEAFAPTSTFTCDGGLEVPGITNQRSPHPQRSLGGTGMTEYRVALETDNEYLQNLFGGSIDEAVAYAATLVAATNTILVRDVQSRQKISYIRVWEGVDPWQDTDTIDQIFAFRELWNADMNQVDRNTAHFLSGRWLGGGAAWINVLCNESYGYALSADLDGSFPLPLTQGAGNWDVVVFAHETGHNYGALHTHELTPPVDNCGNGDCSQPQSTLMSYCHTCPGGITNTRLAFHPRTQATMRSQIELSDCGSDVEELIELNGFFTLLEGRWAVPVISRVDYLDPDENLVATTPIGFEYFVCPFSDNGKNDTCINPFGTSLMLDPDQTYLIEVLGSDDTFYNFGFVRPTGQ